ncbi:FeoB-associated Cys-rich membrane protein [Sphingobacterium chuzhouense]|uniref:FeoB-associated Cys-rich membrane protein n=1 Tax=Sphingobacterium chuzhouense TaxID=1742264 RepID=A0ABR7XV89_9SPHI|nr:FeoB-associated Cys-rich membrane protein [Sphingobacterium chuzhouense]
MVQYIIIAVLFIIALVFMVRKFLPSKNKQQGCNKGCGCSMTDVENNKK